MRILWVSTACIGPVAKILDMPQSGSSGGWIQSEYDAFIPTVENDTEMFFLCASRSIKKGDVLKKTSDIGTAYCVNLPRISLGLEPSNKLFNSIKNIIDEVSPDIIHIWGTESNVVYAAAKAAPNIKKVLFIQGLLGIHYRYLNTYISDISNGIEKLGKISITDKLKRRFSNIFWKKQVEFEQFIIKSCDNVIIDNKFSETYCKSVSQNINCHYRFLCPNQVFYNNKWDYDKCEKNTIFTVFNKAPIKALHQLLRAVAIVKHKYPDFKLLIPGPFSIKDGKLMDKKHLSEYECWVSDFIKDNHLEENIVFLGKLSPAEMAENISKCNVFVNSSCMEVHALSLRESMAVGAPSISSLCGSVIEYIKHGENGLIYRYEEHEMLAHLIESVFSNREFAEKLSKNAIETMKVSEGRDHKKLLDIYHYIIGEK